MNMYKVIKFMSLSVMFSLMLTVLSAIAFDDISFIFKGLVFSGSIGAIVLLVGGLMVVVVDGYKAITKSN